VLASPTTTYFQGAATLAYTLVTTLVQRQRLRLEKAAKGSRNLYVL
jgi:hypothetical protein